MGATKRKDELSPEVMALVERDRPRPPETELQKIRDKIAKVREFDLDIEDMNAALDEMREERSRLVNEELPALFEGVQIDKLGIDAEGNLPAYDAALQPVYRGVLPKDPERRAAALALLNDLGAGHLVATEIVIEFEPGKEDMLEPLLSFLTENNIDHQASASVHHMTLTAWVTNRFRDNDPLSDAELKTLGAYVGKTVKLKQRKM